MKNFSGYSRILIFAALVGSGVWAQAPAAPPATHTSTKKAAAQDPGERKFQTNCSRCHNPPEMLSPRIAGTVLRHMRVRASLTPQDERDILRFLAP